MLCTEEMGTLLSRYVDGELAEKERKSIETHLEACASCRDVLNLFQRNDNVLNNALVGEAFGAQTVDAVMTEIRRLEEPMVVAPIVEDVPDPQPVAMRQVIQVTRMWPFAAAAALMLACLGAFLALTKYGGLGGGAEIARKDFEELRLIAKEAERSKDVTIRALHERLRDLAQHHQDFQYSVLIKGTKESTGIAYVNHRAIVVQANFSLEKFGLFQIFRCKEVSNGRYEPWSTLADELRSPEYRDIHVEAGKNYMYQVRAIYRKPPSPDKLYEDSVAMVQMLPLAGGQDPRKSLRVRFIGSLPDKSAATFEVSRYENEAFDSHFFSVKVGEKIGDVLLIDGKPVDFSTRHILHSVSEGEEVFSVGGTPLTRRYRQAQLRSDPKAKDVSSSSFSLRPETEQFVPLPK
jgi:hypothetical protein